MESTVTGRGNISTFGGLNVNNTAGGSEFMDMSNIDSHEYPYFTTRRKNMLIDEGVGSKVICATSYDKSLLYLKKDEQNNDEIDVREISKEYGENTLIYNQTIEELKSDCTGKQQMVVMGAELILFPQWIAFNMETSEVRSLQIKAEITGDVYFKMCNENGIAYGGEEDSDNIVVNSVSDVAAKTACKNNGYYLLSKNKSTDNTYNLSSYYSTNGMWMNTDYYLGVYVPYSAFNASSVDDAINNLGIEKDAVLDWYVTLENMPQGFTDLIQNEQLLYKVTANESDVVFIFKNINKWNITRHETGTSIAGPPAVYLIDQESGKRTISSDNKMVIKNDLPSDLDFIVSEGNRLFACSSKKHEIYACKLGDARMWKQFAGLSTDSYAATIGSPGVFTGATVFNNVPIFFKENCIHKINGNTPSSFNISYDYFDGVKIGSDKSIVRVGNYLIYHSRRGFVYYTGSQPEKIDDTLGDNVYKNVLAGEKEGHYIAFCNNSILDYDLSKNLWYKQDINYDVNVVANASCDLLAFYEYSDDEWDYYYLVDYGRNLNEYNRIMSDYSYERANEDVKDENINYYAESGIIGRDTMEHKYISRLLFKFHLDFGAAIRIYLKYDYNEDWELVYTDSNTEDKPRVTKIPIIPRRHEHLRYKIEGSGNVIIYGIEYDVSEGSEIR